MLLSTIKNLALIPTPSCLTLHLSVNHRLVVPPLRYLLLRIQSLLLCKLHISLTL